ncbi:MAG TPA: ribonuclease R, partial [Gammaproteobacteria bacterium]|nr:ribonuclease R [Gammaproteobacteria bacterium]
HVSTLKNDYYHYDDKSHSLSAKRGGIRYALGDVVVVRVVRVDLDERKIDFEVFDAEGDQKKSKKSAGVKSENAQKKKPRRKRSPEKKARRSKGDDGKPT